MPPSDAAAVAAPHAQQRSSVWRLRRWAQPPTPGGMGRGGRGGSVIEDVAQGAVDVEAGGESVEVVPQLGLVGASSCVVVLVVLQLGNGDSVQFEH